MASKTCAHGWLVLDALNVAVAQRRPVSFPTR
jgi:hypothetical protein